MTLNSQATNDDYVASKSRAAGAVAAGTQLSVGDAIGHVSMSGGIPSPPHYQLIFTLVWNVDVFRVCAAGQLGPSKK